MQCMAIMQTCSSDQVDQLAVPMVSLLTEALELGRHLQGERATPHASGCKAHSAAHMDAHIHMHAYKMLHAL